MHIDENKTDKFVAMTGFAKRSGKIVYGYDNLRGAKNIKLLAVSDSASDNLKSDMSRLAKKLDVPMITAPMLELTMGNNVKALGLSDSNMARAVTDYVSGGATKYKIQFGSRR